MNLQTFKEIVQRVVGPVGEWNEYSGSIRFRVLGDIRFPMIVALSEALGTDRINFNLGTSGEPDYSEVTPGTDAVPGYIEVLWPLADKPERPRPPPGPAKLTLDLDDG